MRVKPSFTHSIFPSASMITTALLVRLATNANRLDSRCASRHDNVMSAATPSARVRDPIKTAASDAASHANTDPPTIPIRGTASAPF
jgi:hypothetical protein